MTRRARAWAPFVAVCLLLSPFVVGFGLDQAELECEQTAVALEGCCPPGLFDSGSCRQVSGCGKPNDQTLVTREESRCLQSNTCEALLAKDVCGRLQKRVGLSGLGGAGPSIDELHAQDSLCDGL